MTCRDKRRSLQSRGQALLETALILPLLLLLVFNVVNFGYFYLIGVNLTGAARSSVLYAIEGAATPAAGSLPSSGGSSPTTNTRSVTYLIYQDLTGALGNPTGVTVQVCSQVNVNSSTNSGVNGGGATPLRSNCESCTSSGCSAANGYKGSPVPDYDPEQPDFILNQVRIQYTFNTLIPGKIFSIPLWASPLCNGGTCTFTRYAEMRAMN